MLNLEPTSILSLFASSIAFCRSLQSPARCSFVWVFLSNCSSSDSISPVTVLIMSWSSRSRLFRDIKPVFLPIGPSFITPFEPKHSPLVVTNLYSLPILPSNSTAESIESTTIVLPNKLQANGAYLLWCFTNSTSLPFTWGNPDKSLLSTNGSVLSMHMKFTLPPSFLSLVLSSNKLLALLTTTALVAPSSAASTALAYSTSVEIISASIPST